MIKNELQSEEDREKESAIKDKEVVDRIKKLDLPEEKKQHIIATIEMHRGPIPPPEVLEAYKNLYPKAAEEIIENALDESKHRRHLENARQKRRGHLAWVVLIGVYFIMALFILASFYLILNNHKIIGSIFAGLGFLSLLGTTFDTVKDLSGNEELLSDSQSKIKAKDKNEA
jgi:uncharacterized membrane protein